MVPLLVSEQQDEIILQGIQQGVELGKHFSNSLKWAKRHGYQYGDCPNAERISQSIITIPCHYNLSKRQLKKIENFLSSSLLRKFI